MPEESMTNREPGQSQQSSRWRWIVPLVAVGLAVIVGLLLYYVPRPRKDCTFSGWKSTVGVDLEAKVGDLDAVHTKVGLTNQEVREFDTLLKDYALKYDAACNDFTNGRMNQAEYTCRRRNMDQLLDALRTFAQAVDAAKSITDASAQATELRTVLQRLGAAAKAGYAAGCVSAMTVDPSSLTFTGQTPERSVHIGNGGNNDLTFAIDGLPEAFLAQPTTGSIARGAQPVTVSIYRTLLPPKDPITFRIRSNFDEERAIQITLDSTNAVLYEHLGTAAVAHAPNHEPTVQDALAVVDPLLAQDAVNRDALKYFVAMGALTQAGQQDQALAAYQTAVATHPALVQNPAALVSSGLVLTRKGQTDEALAAFTKAQAAPGQRDDPAKSAAGVLAASLELSRGNTNEAEAHLQTPEVANRLQADTTLQRFAKSEFKGVDVKKTFGHEKIGAAK
jgi:tetratricopeptide (TPR) repeat protein